MVQKEILLKEINKNNGIISTKEVLKFGIHKDVLKKLTEKKEIIKLSSKYNVNLSRKFMRKLAGLVGIKKIKIR